MYTNEPEIAVSETHHMLHIYYFIRDKIDLKKVFEFVSNLNCKCSMSEAYYNCRQSNKTSGEPEGYDRKQVKQRSQKIKSEGDRMSPMWTESRLK